MFRTEMSKGWSGEELPGRGELYRCQKGHFRAATSHEVEYFLEILKELPESGVGKR